MPNQIQIRRLALRRNVAFDFGLIFGVPTPCRYSCRKSCRSSRRATRENRRSAGPVASAHRPEAGARANALLPSNDAGCLRALANLSASFDCNSPLLGPATRSGRSRVPRWPGNKPRGGQRRKLSCERSANAYPKMPARASAPDRRPIPSLRSVIPQVGGQSRCARNEAPHQSRLGALLPLSLVGTRSCFCRERFSQRWGASFTFRRLGAAYHGSPALGGLRKGLPKEANASCQFLRSLGRPARFVQLRSMQTSLPENGWAASARPIRRKAIKKSLDQPQCNSVQCTTKLRS